MSAPLMNPPGWGNIEDVVYAPPLDVPGDATWISAIGAWIFMPIVLPVAALVACIPKLFVFYNIGCSCCRTCWCSIYSSVLAGRPLWRAPAMWRGGLANVFAFAANSFTRLKLFLWEWRAFGSGDYFWQGEGVWTWRHSQVEEMLKGDQERKTAFACIRAAVPDLFPDTGLIFLPNKAGVKNEWRSIRLALHQLFLDTGAATYKDRVRKLSGLLAESWPSPKMQDLNDKTKLQKAVAKCVFYVLLGDWLDDADATTMIGWRTQAGSWVFPRLFHRLIFNVLIRRVQKLRVETVRLVEKRQLQQAFVNLNESLPPEWRRTPVVKMCDETMFVCGFAGIGGTSACVESTAAFLQAKAPDESAKEKIDFKKYPTGEAMVTAYKSNPIAYVKEVCRLDPPVTSATSSFPKDTMVPLGGSDIMMPEGTLNQYVVSMANRDEAVFAEPEVFDPTRGNLSDALTWNGAFGKSQNDDKVYPRICPGRYLSLDVATTVIGHVLGLNRQSA